MKRSPSSFSILIVSIVPVLCGLALTFSLTVQPGINTSTSKITVRFFWPDVQPRVIEQEATSKLEALFAKVQGVRDIYSRSGNSSGTIEIVLDKGVNIDAIRFEINTLIRQIWPKLPDGINYPQIFINNDGSQERPLLSYSIQSNINTQTVKQYVEENIRPKLANLSGIGKVEVYGASPMEWVIEFDVHKYKSLGITFDVIKNAVADLLKKESFGIGKYPISVDISPEDEKTPTGRKYISLPVVLRNPFISNEDLMNIPLKTSGGRTLFLKDVSVLRYVESSPQSYYRINGMNTVNILLYAQPGQNNVLVSEKVKLLVKNLAGTLPRDYKILMGDDSTEYLHAELLSTIWYSIITLGILVVFTFIATKNVKYPIMVILVLVGNLSTAIIFYYFFRIQIHIYSLAGITISMGLMTDNIIIMSSHIRSNGDRKVWLAMFAGTLGILSSLMVVFFLDEKLKFNLIDFVNVIMVNQVISLITAFFIIPALMDVLKINVSSKNDFKVIRIKKLPLILRSLYKSINEFVLEHKVIAIVVLVLSFGLPIYLLPTKLKDDTTLGNLYNATLGNDWYVQNCRPLVNIIFGGTLRLFNENIFNRSSLSRPSETFLVVNVSMPKGSTISHANVMVGEMEEFLRRFKEIKIFQSSITSSYSTLNIYFKNNYRHTEFPVLLKEQIVRKAIDLGGAEWSVYGIGDAFSNEYNESGGGYAIMLLGYNYDHLNVLADAVKENLLKNNRIKEVFIVSDRSYFKLDDSEFVLKVNSNGTPSGVDLSSMFTALRENSLDKMDIATVVDPDGKKNISLRALNKEEADIWALKNNPLYKRSALYKLSGMSNIEREQVAPIVSKENQQYRLYLQFDYIGPGDLARKHIKRIVEDYKEQIPLGYKISFDDNETIWWNQQDSGQYWMLLIIIGIIFIIGTILFESFLQPLAVILVLPVAYIGAFLSFYFFDLNFDQGGFAAFVMLTGVAVNITFYIINDYNNLIKLFSNGKISKRRLYTKALYAKIGPICLTILSTTIGFIPFIIGGEAFWVPLAVGTIGGILFIIIGIIVYMPLFLRLG